MDVTDSSMPSQGSHVTRVLRSRSVARASHSRDKTNDSEKIEGCKEGKDPNGDVHRKKSQASDLQDNFTPKRRSSRLQARKRISSISSASDIKTVPKKIPRKSAGKPNKGETSLILLAKFEQLGTFNNDMFKDLTNGTNLKRFSDDSLLYIL